MFSVYGLLIDFSSLLKCLDFQDREILTIDYSNFSSVTKDENKQEKKNGWELLWYLQLEWPEDLQIF